MFLILTDAFLKWFDVLSMNDIKSNTLIDCLLASFWIRGLPDIIISDNGPSFLAVDLKNFVKKN